MKYFVQIAIIFLVVNLSSNISIFAQGFSFFPSTIETKWDYKEELVMKVNAKNMSSLNLSISYTVLELTMTYLPNFVMCLLVIPFLHLK